MLFYLWRIIIWIIGNGVIVSIFLTRKRKKIKLMIIFLTVWIGVISMSSTPRIDNLFVSFKTPEDAFAYSRIGHIEAILEGDENAFICYEYGDAHRNIIFPKTTDGYKLSAEVDKKTIARSFLAPEGNFFIVHLRGSEEYFLSGLSVFSTAEHTFMDCYGKSLGYVETKLQGYEVYTCIVYARIEGDVKDYYLVVDGKKIRFDFNYSLFHMQLNDEADWNTRGIK